MRGCPELLFGRGVVREVLLPPVPPPNSVFNRGIQAKGNDMSDRMTVRYCTDHCVPTMWRRAAVVHEDSDVVFF